MKENALVSVRFQVSGALATSDTSDNLMEALFHAERRHRQDSSVGTKVDAITSIDGEDRYREIWTAKDGFSDYAMTQYPAEVEEYWEKMATPAQKFNAAVWSHPAMAEAIGHAKAAAETLETGNGWGLIALEGAEESLELALNAVRTLKAISADGVQLPAKYVVSCGFEPATSHPSLDAAIRVADRLRLAYPDTRILIHRYNADGSNPLLVYRG